MREEWGVGDKKSDYIVDLRYWSISTIGSLEDLTLQCFQLNHVTQHHRQSEIYTLLMADEI
jgi:hypothetical protein